MLLYLHVIPFDFIFKPHLKVALKYVTVLNCKVHVTQFRHCFYCRKILIYCYIWWNFEFQLGNYNEETIRILKFPYSFSWVKAMLKRYFLTQCEKENNNIPCFPSCLKKETISICSRCFGDFLITERQPNVNSTGRLWSHVFTHHNCLALDNKN